MADINTVLERLVTEAAFRARLRSDPAGALAGYALSQEDLEVLAASLDDPAGNDHAVEQRTSKSAFLGALTGLLEAGGGGSADAASGGAAPDETTAEGGDTRLFDIYGLAPDAGGSDPAAGEGEGSNLGAEVVRDAEEDELDPAGDAPPGPSGDAHPEDAEAGAVGSTARDEAAPDGGGSQDEPSRGTQDLGEAPADPPAANEGIKLQGFGSFSTGKATAGAPDPEGGMNDLSFEDRPGAESGSPEAAQAIAGGSNVVDPLPEDEGSGVPSDEVPLVPPADDGDEAAKKDGTISIRGKDISIRGSGDREG